MTSAVQNLPILVLSPHSRCNCRCVMCDVWKSPSKCEISVGELQRHVEDIQALGVQWVIFTGGEPLMHRDLFRLCGVLRPLGIRLTLLSSGLLLGRYAESIVWSFDEVIVSLDGPRRIHDVIRRTVNAFQLLAEGVAALHAVEPRFSIAARCTVQKLNHNHLVDTVDAAYELGLRSISFLAADLDSTAFNRATVWPDAVRREVGLNEVELSALEREIERIIRDRSARVASGFVRETPDKLRRIAAHFRASLGLGPWTAPACNAPWVSAVVEADLTVRPCFFHAPIGTLAGSSLPVVLNGPLAVEFRRSLNVAENAICRRCVCSIWWRGADE